MVFAKRYFCCCQFSGLRFEFWRHRIRKWRCSCTLVERTGYHCCCSGTAHWRYHAAHHPQQSALHVVLHPKLSVSGFAARIWAATWITTMSLYAKIFVTARRKVSSLPESARAISGLCYGMPWVRNVPENHGWSHMSYICASVNMENAIPCLPCVYRSIFSCHCNEPQKSCYVLLFAGV